MKTSFLFSLLINLILTQTLIAQQVTLRGQVSIHNSGYETGEIDYVQDAYVSAAYAGSIDTDVNGKFNLIFSGMDEGTSVEVNVEKAGLEIVNKKDLEDVVIGRLTPLKIYLAPKGQIAKARVKLYNVSLKTLTERHDRLIASLRKEDVESQEIIEDLEEKLSTVIANRYEAEELLNQQLEVTKRRLPGFTQRLAKINLDFASEMYRQAYEYFKKGEIEKAIETIDEPVLDKQAKESIAQIKQLRTDISNMDTSFTLSKVQVHKLVNSYYLQAISLEEQSQIYAAIDTLHQAVQVLFKVSKGDEYRSLERYLKAAFYYRQQEDLAKEFYCLRRAIQTASIQLDNAPIQNPIWELSINYLFLRDEIKEHEKE